jgi:hypothetical protein
MGSVRYLAASVNEHPPSGNSSQWEIMMLKGEKYDAVFSEP